MNTPQVRIDGRKVKSEMILRDVTVAQIAEALGVSRPAIYNALNGHNTTLDTVSRIASMIDTDPVSILKTVTNGDDEAQS